MVPPDGFEPSPHRVRAEYATSNTSKGWVCIKKIFNILHTVKEFFNVPSRTNTESQDDTIVS